MKKLSDFTSEAFVKNINEEKMVKVIVETVEENNLTEQETVELIDELFGIGATLQRARAKAAHPFKMAHAAIKGATARVKEKVSTAVGKIKAKSAEMDAAAAKKLNQTKATQGKAKAAIYKKASGGMDRPTPVRTMTAADKERLAANKAKATPAKPKMSTGASGAKAKTGKPKAPQATSTLAKEKSKPTAKTEPTVLKNKAPKVNPTRPVAKKTIKKPA